MPLQLHYWPIQGRVELLKMICHYLKVQYEAVPVNSKEELPKRYEDVKPLLPNLPILVDGDVVVTQTIAIAAHIVNKGGDLTLFGNTPQDRVTVTMIIGHIGDITPMVFAMGKGDDDAKAANRKNVETKLGQLENLLGDKTFFTGYVTVADFVLLASSNLLNGGIKALWGYELKDKFPGLERCRSAVKELPGVKEYMNSDEHMKTPVIFPFMIGFKLESNDH